MEVQRGYEARHIPDNGFRDGGSSVNHEHICRYCSLELYENCLQAAALPVLSSFHHDVYVVYTRDNVEGWVNLRVIYGNYNVKWRLVNSPIVLCTLYQSVSRHS
jgi:hypothetical protein